MFVIDKDSVQKITQMGLMVLLVTLLAVSVWGCGQHIPEQHFSESQSPFVTDHVATVRIVMKEQDWTALQQNALTEQYVKADFRFDGELVPDVGVRPKGNSSLKEAAISGSPRFSIKADFNLFNRARDFRGLKNVNLNNEVIEKVLGSLRQIRLCRSARCYYGQSREAGVSASYSRSKALPSFFCSVED